METLVELLHDYSEGYSVKQRHSCLEAGTILAISVLMYEIERQMTSCYNTFQEFYQGRRFKSIVEVTWLLW